MFLEYKKDKAHENFEPDWHLFIEMKVLHG